MLESPVSWSEVTTAVGTGGEPVQVLQLTPSALSRPSVGPQVSPGLHLTLSLSQLPTVHPRQWVLAGGGGPSVELVTCGRPPPLPGFPWCEGP